MFVSYFDDNIGLSGQEAQLRKLRCNTNQQRGEVKKEPKDKLSNREIARYGRQLILPEIGVQGIATGSCIHVNLF